MAKRRRKKKKLSYRAIVLILIVLVAAAGGIAFLIDQNSPSTKRADLDTYFSAGDTDGAAIVTDGILSEMRGIRQDDELYFSAEEAALVIDKRLYYDKAAGLISVSTPTVYETYTVDELEADGSLEEIDGSLCLSLSFLEKWTDMTAEVFESPLRVVITKTWPYETASAAEDIKIRTEASIKGDILADVSEGDELRVLALSENEKWTQVTTEDGLTGYVESEKLGEIREAGTDHVSSVGDYTSLVLPEKANMVFYATNNADTNSFLGDRLAGVTGVNIVSPTWYFLDGGDQVTSVADENIVDELHDEGYLVFALINDFDGAIASYAETFETLASTVNRSAIVRTIADEALSMGIDGLNLDVELVSEDCGPAYLELVRELSAECRKSGLYFTIDTYVPMNWSAYLDREELGILADYVIIMCYDEHYEGDEEAGSVASMTFTENGLNRALRDIPAEKVIAAIPFYTRVWTTEGDGTVTSRILTMDEAADYVSENGMTVTYDEESGQNLAEKKSGDSLTQIWLEDTDSLTQRMELIKERNLAGVAEWDLGSQNDEVWDIISQGLAE